MTEQKKFTAEEIEKLKARALKLWDTDETSAKDLGNALLAVKKALKGKGRGAFKAWWKKHDLVQSRVSYCMDLADGGLERRKKKSKKPESRERQNAKKAVQAVNKKISLLFKTCVSATDTLSSFTIREQLRDAVAATVAQAATLAGWKLDTPKAKKAGDELHRAIVALTDAIYYSDDAASKAAGA